MRYVCLSGSFDSERGQTLLEVLIASAILGVVLWGSMGLFRASQRANGTTATQAAIRSFEEEIRSEVMQASVEFFDDASSGSIKQTHGHGHGAPHTSTSCQVTSADLANYLWLDLPSGLSLRLVRPTDTLASLYPPPYRPVPETSRLQSAFQRCQQAIGNVNGSYANLLASNAITFCVAAFPTAGPASQVSDQDSLLAMMPVFGYFSFFNFYTGQKTAAGPVNPARQMNCADYTLTVHPDSIPPYLTPAPNPPPSVLHYLYYTLFWRNLDATGELVASYSGMMLKGITP